MLVISWCWAQKFIIMPGVIPAASERPPLELDTFDRALLALVQTDARMTVQTLGEQIGLSPAACHRRLARLRREGVITEEVAIVDPAMVGRPLTIVVQVTLERERADLFDAFKDAMRQADAVMQCYYVTGGTDFILILTAADMQDYDTFTRRYFFDNPNIQRFQTNVVMDTVKRSVVIPLG